MAVISLGANAFITHFRIAHQPLYSKEDGGYITDIPGLDSCSAFGATPEEALAEVGRAREAWLEAARQEGKAIPPARYRPFIYQLTR